MKDFKSIWTGSSPGARSALVIAAFAIVAATATIGNWAMTKEYEALFTGLAEQDASTMVAELDRMKIPYRLEDGGRRILVPQELVHKTRLQLVGKNLPLHGAVGFEIFNNTDFGMTEFAQKVNYQRALQGELTRTIMSLNEVQAARVHLVLAESSIFRRDQNRSKASVTVALKPGHTLAREQVSGIQRLVAAAVAGIDAADVTVLDQKGITLSSRQDAQRDGSAWQLETQRQIEDHLVRKAAMMLDRTFGPGQGVVSVDVVLNFDQMKVTTEEVLAAKNTGEAGTAVAGVLVRERQTLREQSAGKDKPDGVGSAVTNTETEYQTGRRVEQIVATPGSVRRINVGVVVPRGVAAERLDRVRQIVAMAVGLNKDRGDGIAVYSLDQMSETAPALAGATAEAATGLVPVESAGPAQAAVRPQPAFSVSADVVLRYAAGLLLLAIAIAAWWRSSRARRPVAMAAPVLLGDAERSRLLENVKLWLDKPAPLQPAKEKQQ